MRKLNSMVGGLAAVAILAMGAWANTTLSVQTMVKGGTAPTRTSLDTIIVYDVRNDGKTFLQFLKTGAGSATVTVVTPSTVNGLAIADQTFQVDAIDGDVFAGPFSTQLFNNGSGNLTFTISNSAAITAVVLRLK